MKSSFEDDNQAPFKETADQPSFAATQNDSTQAQQQIQSGFSAFNILKNLSTKKQEKQESSDEFEELTEET